MVLEGAVREVPSDVVHASADWGVYALMDCGGRNPEPPDIRGFGLPLEDYQQALSGLARLALAPRGFSDAVFGLVTPLHQSGGPLQRRRATESRLTICRIYCVPHIARHAAGTVSASTRAEGAKGILVQSGSCAMIDPPLRTDYLKPHRLRQDLFRASSGRRRRAV